MEEKKPRNFFVPGPVTASFVADSIAKHSSKTEIGGHSIFLGQVRADRIGNKKVIAIEYTAYEPIAIKMMQEIKEALITKYGLTCMHVYHSLGQVATGEISLFVFTSSPHRKEAIEACSDVVERIKKHLPIWGKEILEDQTFHWKEFR